MQNERCHEMLQLATGTEIDFRYST